MKQLYFLLALSLLTLFGCSSDFDDVVAPVNVTLTFSHYWEETHIQIPILIPKLHKCARRTFKH